MTISIDHDCSTGKTPLLPFESSSWQTAGIRVLPAQLARLIGVSKQAVSDWVKSGRVVLGVDGRVDPTAAMERLLKTGDPAKLRARALRPMVDELNRYRARIVDLEAAIGMLKQRIGEEQAAQIELAAALEQAKTEIESAGAEVDFHEGAAEGFSAIFDALEAQLPDAWPAVSAMPENGGAILIVGWLQTALQFGVEQAGNLLSALEVEGGEGDRNT